MRAGCDEGGSFYRRGGLYRRGENAPSGSEGQGLVEYALIPALVALVVIVILWALGPGLGDTCSNIVSNL